MFSLLKGIFGKGDNGEKLLDAGIKGIDALFFTSEEKSQASQKLLTTFIDFQKATQSQNIARRYLAFGVTFIWLILVIAIASFAVIASFAGSEGATAAKDALMTLMGNYVFYPFSGIMAFYFLTHALRAKNG